MVPVVEHRAGQLRASVEIVLADELMELLAVGGLLDKVDLHHIHVAEIVEVVVLVPDVGHTTTHTSGEVAACRTEDDDTATRHILTAVVSGALHDGDGTRVTHGEALTDLSVDVELAGSSTIQTRVAGDDVVLGVEVAADRGQDGDAATGETFTEVVIGLALEFKAHTVNEEGTEALAGRALELDVDRVVGQAFFAILRGDESAEHGTYCAVGVADGIVEVDLFLLLDGVLCAGDDLLVQEIMDVVILQLGAVERRVAGLAMEQVGEVEALPLGHRLVIDLGLLGLDVTRHDELGVTDNLVE